MKTGDWLIFDDCGTYRAGRVVRGTRPDHHTLRVRLGGIGSARRIYKSQVRFHGEALAREVIRLKEEKTA
jgi:hypothetical protein